MVGALFGLAIPAVISSLLARPDSYISLMGEPFWFASGLNFSYVALPRWLRLLSVQMKCDDRPRQARRHRFHTRTRKDTGTMRWTAVPIVLKPQLKVDGDRPAIVRVIPAHHPEYAD